MEQSKAPRPPLVGIIYGEIAYWLLVIGMIIALVGLVIYMTSGGYLDKASLLDHLWKGDNVHTIWEKCGGAGINYEGHWYLRMLSQGDAIAMLGLSVTCFAAVAGMWGAFFGLLRGKGGIFILFALIVAVVLTLSALGILILEM